MTSRALPVCAVHRHLLRGCPTALLLLAGVLTVGTVAGWILLNPPQAPNMTFSPPHTYQPVTFPRDESQTALSPVQLSAPLPLSGERSPSSPTSARRSLLLLPLAATILSMFPHHGSGRGLGSVALALMAVVGTWAQPRGCSAGRRPQETGKPLFLEIIASIHGKGQGKGVSTRDMVQINDLDINRKYMAVQELGSGTQKCIITNRSVQPRMDLQEPDDERELCHQGGG